MSSLKSKVTLNKQQLNDLNLDLKLLQSVNEQPIERKRRDANNLN